MRSVILPSIKLYMCAQCSDTARRSAPSIGSPSLTEPSSQPTPRANWYARLPPTNLSSTCPCTSYRGMSYLLHVSQKERRKPEARTCQHVLSCEFPAAQPVGFMEIVRMAQFSKYVLPSVLGQNQTAICYTPQRETKTKKNKNKQTYFLTSSSW